jgi:glucose-6-phosphate 1-dehydrogenase
VNEPILIAKAQTAPPCTVVIFGASGDLARRKLIPALYNLKACGHDITPRNFAVLGFARRPIPIEEFRQIAHDSAVKYSRLKVDDKCWREFAEGLDYLSGLDRPDGFARLKARLEALEKERGLPPNRVFYLSIPPEAIQECVERLDSEGLIAKPGDRHFSRIVVEKPIGSDLESAREINHTMQSHCDESQIFRIDHYLGKETVQNLLVMRFANTIFERVWSARDIDHVQITVAESEGVGSRAMYYDPAGALRDMVQNHMMQVLAMIGMEPPISLDSHAINDAKLNVLRALKPLSSNEARKMVVRARYAEGLADGQKVPGYLQEHGIPPTSMTETYVALKTYLHNWRWSGVPFYLRTGKRLPSRASLIHIQFKEVPQILFNPNEELPPNALTIRIQPDEGFSFDVLAKQPGLDIAIRPVKMNLSYESEFSENSPDAYERLLLEVMTGDRTLFVSASFVEKSWEFVQSILDQWQHDSSFPMHEYDVGSFGPKAAEDLIKADGREWLNP